MKQINCISKHVTAFSGYMQVLKHYSPIHNTAIK